MGTAYGVSPAGTGTPLRVEAPTGLGSGPATTVLGLSDTVVANGTATTPAANAAIATIAAPGAGVYKVKVWVVMSGTAETAVQNVELRHGATVVGKCGFTAVAGSQQPVDFDRVTVAAAEAITVNATVLATTSAVYTVIVEATRVA